MMSVDNESDVGVAVTQCLPTSEYFIVLNMAFETDSLFKNRF